MGKSMFCPKCGAGDQAGDSYCKRCGEWLPDMDELAKPRLFRRRTRDEKIRKMRILEAVSAALSLTSAGIILSFLLRGGNIQLLFLAAMCGLIVAVYQIVNFYLGYTLQRRIDKSREEGSTTVNLPDANRAGQLNSADTFQTAHTQSVTENTTELLDRVPRKTRDSG
jgi:hypothetical protein